MFIKYIKYIYSIYIHNTKSEIIVMIVLFWKIKYNQTYKWQIDLLCNTRFCLIAVFVTVVLTIMTFTLYNNKTIKKHFYVATCQFDKENWNVPGTRVELICNLSMHCIAPNHFCHVSRCTFIYSAIPGW